MTTEGAGAPNTVTRPAVEIAPDRLAETALGLLADGYRLGLAAAHDEGATLRVVYLFLAGPASAGLPGRRAEVSLRVPALTPQLPTLAGLSFPAGRFEREMHDLFGLVPVGHPLPRRLVRHAHWPAGWYPMRRDAGPPPPFTAADPFPFLTVEGPGVSEIPVGPVHAGLIEPGHFRFSVVGETIVKLKARLWFVHRGVERLFEGADPDGGVELAERISGDTSVGHAIAYSQAVEDALGQDVPAEVHRLRVLLVELERMYNHVADLGALANDVGFGIANAHALRLRERLLRVNATVAGHRLLRGATGPGWARLDAMPDLREVAAVTAEAAELAEITLGHSIVRDRFVGTAVLGPDQARELGCLGPVARASGMPTDARWDHPTVQLPGEPVVHGGGDVLARYLVRRDELAASAALVAELCRAGLPLSSGARHAGAPLLHGRVAEPLSGVGIVEGWRGTIVHRVEVEQGQLSRVKVVDPSWFNWPALPVALAGAIVPDFPLANKSFNLSYAGNDL